MWHYGASDDSDGIDDSDASVAIDDIHDIYDTDGTVKPISNSKDNFHRLFCVINSTVFKKSGRQFFYGVQRKVPNFAC